MNQLKLAAAILAGLITLPLSVAAWNTPGHMLSGVIAYQILPRENASTIAAVLILGKHPSYQIRWR